MSGQATSAKPKPGLLDRLRGSPAKKPALNKPAYYADGGALMGTVVEVENDAGGEPTGFVVETDYGERMRFPHDQFEITERGLIYRPLWKESLYNQIKELEERIRAAETGDSLVVAQLMQLKTFDAQAIKQLKVSHPGQEAVFESFAGMVALYRELRQRLEVLEVERIRARSDLTMHAGDRLLKHSSRREFAKLVLAERRRYEICDINIKHVRKLLKRLHDSPYFPSHLFPLPSEEEDEEDGPPLPFEQREPGLPPSGARSELTSRIPPLPGSPSMPGAGSKPPDMPDLPGATTATPLETATGPEQASQPQVKPRPAGKPRVTFTPAPSALQRPLSLQEPSGTASVADRDPPSPPAPAATPDPGEPRAEVPLPRQALRNWQRQHVPEEAAPNERTPAVRGPKPRRPLPTRAATSHRTLPTRGPGGLASSFQNMVRSGQSPRSPLNMASPGVATSLLSFVNDARTASRQGQGRGKTGGPAMVLNLGR